MIPQHEPQPWMTAKEVADLLGYTPQTFSRYKRRLIAEEALPRPVPGGRFNRAAVLRWHETYADRKAKAEAEALGRTVASLRIGQARSRLEEKYLPRNAA
ncbi:helix-turn-helix transcriptional regulator [Rhizobium halophilum]|uniref:helix-turn-helix transcriptional regulator n=1 Tax=Rhizobium halophilum TaxID=2846852 RepID=UPI001EFED297|nr:helix-turn-helix domain-containing protein [Rhizobium halophilum]MCF6368311.1 helix-turn-helix domain-containing protein [Rhizobium halophilum]